MAITEARIAAIEARLTALEKGAPDPLPAPEVRYILYDPARIMTRPTSGAGWEGLAAMARRTWHAPDLGDNNAQGDSEAVAGALYAVRMNDAAMRAKVIAHLTAAMKSRLTRTLELGRGLFGYIVAANLIGYAEKAFVDWVEAMATHVFPKTRTHSGLQTIILTDHTLNSNWATMCRRSVIGAALYLKWNGDEAQRAAAAKWLRLSVLAHLRDIGAAGDYAELPPLQSAPSGWYGDSNPIAGINPPGATKGIGGALRVLDGVRGADWLRAKRRSDGKEDREAAQWPPTPVTYHWEGLTPQIVTAAILHIHGLVPFNAANNAIVRAVDALYGTGAAAANVPPFVNPASGDDRSAIWLVNHYGGVSFPAEPDAMPDKAGVGHMQWYLG